jgi:nucleoside-diphosphate-sugar epimerase
VDILITGGDGFVGTAYRNYFGSAHKITNVDIKSGIDCRDFFKTNCSKFSLIIHLAAIVGGRERIESDPLGVATDLSIDSEFFNWALRTAQTCPIIYFSSSAAYPINLQVKGSGIKLAESYIDLDDIRSPDFTYGWAKLTGEYLASFGRKLGLKVHVFRPFSGYGENQSLEYPFPSFIKRIVDKADPFEVWGDGEQVRDFIHISDIVNCTLRAVELEYMMPLNLGSGVPTSFNQLAHTMFKIGGFRPLNGIKHIGSRPSGVMFRCSDNSEMLKIYDPKVTLEEGIARALEYWRKV